MPRQPPKKRIRLEPSQTSQLQLALQSGILDNVNNKPLLSYCFPEKSQCYF
jgi:hypothetical protein